ncbi:MAG: hypothetical protein HYV97_08380 [Bdellovibrio sp.]|nr:hypothetical protein [Bdellovibrio sp.]
MADNYMGRVRVIEFEDESVELKRKRELRLKAQWLIYDFAAVENVPLIDIINFKSTDESGEKIPVATFGVKENVFSVAAYSDKFPVSVNGDPVPPGQVQGLQNKDVVEFLECKYLVNTDPELEEEEARRILGQQIIVRTTLGLKRGSQNKEEQYKNLCRERDDCKQLLEISKMKLRDAASKKQLMAAIIAKREELKQQFMMCKVQVAEIESQNLEKVIQENSVILQDLEDRVSKTEKELAQMKEALERRDKLESERKKQMMERDLEREEDELRKKLEELQKKRKGAA